MSNSLVTEENARDVYKLREYDKDFMIHRQSCSLSSEKLITNSISHSEYYQLQKWMRILGEIIEGKVEVDALRDIHRVAYPY